MTSPGGEGEPQPRLLLAIYLRDHLAGTMAGVSLVRRCRRANSGTDLAEVLVQIEDDIVDDRRSLQQMMARLDVSESRCKQLLGVGTELIARLGSR